MKKIPLFSLRIRLLLLALIVVIPGLVLTIYTLVDERQREKVEAQGIAFRLAQIISVQEQDMIEATSELLVTASQVPKIGSNTTQENSRFLAHLLAQFPRYSNLGVADTKGNIIASAVPSAKQVNIADRSYFRAAIETGDFVVGEYEVGRITGKPSVNLAYPIVNESGKRLGVVFAALSLEKLGDLESRVGAQLPEGSTLHKIDRNGILLAQYPDRRGKIGHPSSESPHILKHLTHGQGTVWGIDSVGAAHLYAYSEIQSRLFPTGISLVLDIPEKYALGEVNHIFYRNLVLLSVVFLLILLVGAFANEMFLVRAVNSVRNATLQLGAGNLRARAEEVRGIVEMKQLGKTFNDMAAMLEQREYERREAEEALQRSEQRHRDIVSYAPVGIYQAARNGDFVTVNARLAEILGYDSVEELMQRNLSRDVFLNDKMRESLISKYEPIGTVQILELQWKKKDGSLVWIILSARIVKDRDESTLCYEGFVQDITERKRAEEDKKRLEAQLQQVQKLESLGTLASGIAHDFNNILGIILGHSTRLENLKEDPQKLLQSIKAITKATERGASLVKQLLTFARKTEALFETVSINDMIREINRLLQETFPKTIIISTSLQPDLPTIVADASQIHQVLLNLCVNARDAMPQRGTLSILTRTIKGEALSLRFAKATARQYVQIEVADTGIGMDESTQQRIFEPFFTTKGSGKGTGLGLSVVFGIVEHHNGIIDVRSAPGEGTSFSVYLPIPERALEELQPVRKSLEEIPGGTETILIIEDEEMLRELVKASLLSKGYTVLIAEDGVRGVEMYQSHQDRIALVLSDLGLPALAGQDVFRRIREINPQAKIILASGFIDPETKSEMYKAGVKNFIQKPYLQNEVLQKVRDAIDTNG